VIENPPKAPVFCLGQTGTGGEGGESSIHPHFDLLDEGVGEGEGKGKDRVLVCKPPPPETTKEGVEAGGEDKDLRGPLAGFVGVQCVGDGDLDFLKLFPPPADSSPPC
jgi:hypothetical protein